MKRLLIFLIILTMLMVGCTINQDESIKDLKVDVEKLNDQISSLQEQIIEKNNKIEILNQDLKEKNANQDKENEAIQVTLDYVSVEHKKVFVENEVYTKLTPHENAQLLRKIEPNTVVDVNDLVSIQGEEWLYVTVPAYDSPSNMKGWIRKSQAIPYTKDLTNKVQGDVYIAKGTPIYEVDRVKDINENVKSFANLEMRGRINTKEGDYVYLAAPGGYGFWVKEEHIDYPKPE